MQQHEQELSFFELLTNETKLENKIFLLRTTTFILATRDNDLVYRH